MNRILCHSRQERVKRSNKERERKREKRERVREERERGVV